MNTIISKWTVNYKEHHLAITADKKVYDVDTLEQLVECWNNGSITYRYPRTTKRIGAKTINKHCVKNIITLQHFCPF